MSKPLIIVVNVITGIFVTANSLIGYGISGIGEGSIDTPTAKAASSNPSAFEWDSKVP